MELKTGCGIKPDIRYKRRVHRAVLDTEAVTAAKKAGLEPGVSWGHKRIDVIQNIPKPAVIAAALPKLADLTFRMQKPHPDVEASHLGVGEEISQTCGVWLQWVRVPKF